MKIPTSIIWPSEFLHKTNGAQVHSVLIDLHAIPIPECLFQRLHNLPGEVRVASTEVAVSGSLLVPLVSSPLEIQGNGNHAWPEVERLGDQSQNLSIRNLPTSIGVHKDGQGLWYTNSIRYLCGKES